MVFCCGMYKRHCLSTACDNVVSSIPVLSTVCVGVPSCELHKPEYLSCGMTECLQTNCGVLWSKNKLWGCCCAEFVAVPSFVGHFC